MKLNVIGDILTELYYNGVVRATKKMEPEDFMEIAKASKGSIVRQYYYAERKLGTHIEFVGANSTTLELKVVEDKRKRKIVDIDFSKYKIMRLPNGDGILRITPIDLNGSINFTSGLTRIPAGSEWAYANQDFLDDTGERLYVFTMDQIRLYGSVGELPNEVEVVAVIDNPDSDISEDIAWDIINYTLGTVLKVVGFPIDRTDNSSPGTEIIRSKLSEAQAA